MEENMNFSIYFGDDNLDEFEFDGTGWWINSLDQNGWSGRSPITRSSVKEAISKNLGTFVPECCISDLIRNDLETLVEEQFFLRGFTRESVETWIENCYEMDINPLPALRKILSGICEVTYAHYYPGSGREDELIVINEDNSVRLIYSDGAWNEPEDYSRRSFILKYLRDGASRSLLKYSNRWRVPFVDPRYGDEQGRILGCRRLAVSCRREPVS